MTILWKINAGRRSIYADQFKQESVVAISWREGGDYTQCRSREEVWQIVRATYADWKEKQIDVASNQIWRFLNELKIGDKVTTYDPDRRVYLLGEITGNPEYRPDIIEEIPLARRVNWTAEKSRDILSDRTKGNLGAILTLFKVSAFATAELMGEQPPSTEISSPVDLEESSPVDPFEAIEDRALEKTKDRLLGLGWEDMQEVVAALLRALGYRTIISPPGSDRGRDIIASRDGFGFERPRIVVEVKHRREPITAPHIRSFVGGRHPDDRGLYVSTGGFTREAHYEADRATTATHLMTLDGLARALIENYERLDDKGKDLIPMTKIYWPL